MMTAFLHCGNKKFCENFNVLLHIEIENAIYTQEKPFSKMIEVKQIICKC